MTSGWYGYLVTILPEVGTSIISHIIILTLGGLIGFFFRPIVRYIRLLRSGLRSYTGKYYGYRWGRTTLVEPRIEIAVSWSGRFILKWWMPGTKKPSIAHLYGTLNRELFWIGADYRKMAYSYFVIHANSYANVEVLSGMYCFMNDANSMVSGKFLLSRELLSEDLVKELLPKDSVYSSQLEASSLYEDMFRRREFIP